MKKIAFFLGIFPDKAKTFEINHILNAYNAGYKIRIFPRYFRALKDSSQPEIIERYGLMSKVIKPSSYYSPKWLFDSLQSCPRKLIPYLIKSLNPFRFGLSGLIFLFVLHMAVQFHRDSDFDIIHCQYGPNGLIAAWLKELGLLNGKIITTFHGFDSHINFLSLWRSYFFSSTRIWSPILFKHSDLVTVNTPYLLKQVIELGANPNKIELLPMGVDTSFFLPKKNSHKKELIRLISVGRLVKLKSHHLGIQAVNRLVKEGLNLEYWIIGDGTERHNLRRLIEKLHLKRHVKLLGARNQSEIKKWMQESAVFLVTSTYDWSGRREAQGVVTAEAQACGLPVVAFRSGGVPYTIEDGKTGFLAEEKNVDEFSRHLRKLCTDDALRKKMGHNARNFIEANFSNTELSKKQLSLYEKVLLE
jgi:colanic acid/amylovoran biosynthesis glycosyltransferase